MDPAAPSSGTNLNAGSTTYNNSNDSNHRQFSFKVSVKDHQLELQASYCHLDTKKNQTTIMINNIQQQAINVSNVTNKNCRPNTGTTHLQRRNTLQTQFSSPTSTIRVRTISYLKLDINILGGKTFII